MNLRTTGKHFPKFHPNTKKFEDYVTGTLPVAQSTNNLKTIYQKLGVSDPGILFPIDHNDRYGCCTIAGAAHSSTIWNGLIGKKSILSASKVLSIYRHLTGGEDTGCNMLDVTNYMQKTGINEKVLGVVSINPKNIDHIKLAIQYFGCIYLGMDVQENAIKDFESKTPWTAGKLTGDGHCVVGADFDQNGMTILTWGGDIEGTWDWFKCSISNSGQGEAYAFITKETPSFTNFNMDQLKTDLQELSN
jgi:hypothetical protein